ncbi:magnesium and cobalt transport protein CorA [Glycomyces sp. L485]|uniref:magnesium and cobalt transport protein CorA n=1 Tax=Glycomyces sp. L485 TaxID=2909235 RepID=UPI001F4B572F|nr:magnesium and cobalt transport protein CorA [Glycomyces sp. L485]MCH7230767.1 magnesium and cobalt transport protein CorA [Glycomyces sp. L485]
MVGYWVVAPGDVTRHDGDLDSLGFASEELDAGEYLWVELESPGKAELEDTLDSLGLDRFGVVGDQARRHPKVDQVGGTYLVVAKTLWYVQRTRQVETGDLVLYTDGRSLVTVRHGEVDPIAAALRRVASDPELREEGAPGAVYALFECVVEAYATAIEALTDDVDAVEREVFSDARRELISQIYSLIRETLEFQNAVKPLIPFAHMVRQRHTSMPVFSRPHFRGVAEHLLRIENSVDTCMNLLTTVLTAHQGRIATWQNEDMRKISAWAAIAIVPTVIAGIHGMNFQYMPELHWVFGYPLVLTATAAICFSLYRGFKRNGWL